MEIKGKVFIVTGGASGLGEGTARMLAAQGGTVVIADMQTDKGEQVAKDIGGAFVKCDVSNEADGQAVVAKAVSLGKLMGLVNCAGIAPAEKTVGKNGAHALAVFSKTITVNLIGSFNMIRLAAEAMCKNDPESTGERGVLMADNVAKQRYVERGYFRIVQSDYYAADGALRVKAVTRVCEKGVEFIRRQLAGLPLAVREQQS